MSSTDLLKALETEALQVIEPEGLVILAKIFHVLGDHVANAAETHPNK